MVAVETWIGINKDEDGKITSEIPYEAEDATTKDINPDDISKAIDHVKEECDKEMEKFSTILDKVEDDSLTAMKIEGETLEKYITSIRDVSENAGADIAETIEPLVDKAIKFHDEQQKKYNERAKAKAMKHDDYKKG